MTGKSDKGKSMPRGEKSVLGNKQEFKKDEPQDASRDKQAKEDVGHMGEASRENRSAKDKR